MLPCLPAHPPARSGAPHLRLLLIALLLAGCGGGSSPGPTASPSAADTPRAAFGRWQDASRERDAEAYFEAIVPPNRVEFLMNVVASWRAGDWRAAGEAKSNAIGEVLRTHGLDGLRQPLGFDEHARINALESLPAVLAQLFVAADGTGPRNIPLWDLLPQPVSLGEVGEVDNYGTAPATATFRAFDIDTMQPRERTDAVRFFRGKDGRWRVSPPGF